MNQMQKAAPYKVDSEKPETEYEVMENGDVKITQKTKAVSYWKSREFLSLMRENEEALKNTKYNYSEEFIEKMKNQEKEIVEEINLMKPIMEKSGELTKIEYEKQRHEGLLKNLKVQLEAKEPNMMWFQNIWFRTKDELKEGIIKELTKEEQSKLLKIVQKMKRKNLR